MKKLFALLLALIMVFCFTACADDDDVRGDVSSGSNNSTSSEEATFDTGKVSSNKYTNKFPQESPCFLLSFPASWAIMKKMSIEEALLC